MGDTVVGTRYRTVLGLLADELGESTIRCAPRYWIEEQMGRDATEELEASISQGNLARCEAYPSERVHFPPIQDPLHKRPE